MLKLNDVAPNFTADTTEGPIELYPWMESGWAILFSHPKDFTPVCTTELGHMAGLLAEFAKRNCKVMGVSVDTVEDHQTWKKDILDVCGTSIRYPLIGDSRLEIAKLYGMLPADAGHQSSGRTAVDNATVRSVFIIDPNKRIRLILTYPMTTGRNFDEIVRVLDSMQLTDRHKVATPAQWNFGERVIVVPSLSDGEAVSQFGSFDRVKPYLRYVEQPSDEVERC